MPRQDVEIILRGRDAASPAFNSARSNLLRMNSSITTGRNRLITLGVAAQDLAGGGGSMARLAGTAASLAATFGGFAGIAAGIVAIGLTKWFERSSEGAEDFTKALEDTKVALQEVRDLALKDFTADVKTASAEGPTGELKALVDLAQSRAEALGRANESIRLISGKLEDPDLKFSDFQRGQLEAELSRLERSRAAIRERAIESAQRANVGASTRIQDAGAEFAAERQSLIAARGIDERVAATERLIGATQTFRDLLEIATTGRADFLDLGFDEDRLFKLRQLTDELGNLKGGLQLLKDEVKELAAEEKAAVQLGEAAAAALLRRSRQLGARAGVGLIDTDLIRRAAEEAAEQRDSGGRGGAAAQQRRNEALESRFLTRAPGQEIVKKTETNTKTTADENKKQTRLQEEQLAALRQILLNPLPVFVF